MGVSDPSCGVALCIFPFSHLWEEFCHVVAEMVSVSKESGTTWWPMGRVLSCGLRW